MGKVHSFREIEISELVQGEQREGRVDSSSGGGGQEEKRMVGR